MKASKITAVDFFDDLTSPYARKRFFWGFGIFAALCAVALYLSRSLLPANSFRDVTDAVIIDVLSGSLIVLAFYVLYTYFIGPNEGLRDVSVTRSKDIRERMEQLPLETRQYMFWGRSGSYLRSYSLLVLDEQSRRKKLVTDVYVVLPDPTDERLITSYQEILISLGEKAEPNTLLANVLATSVVCAIINANNKFIRIRLFYSKFLPAFRVDLSENGAILTQDDPAKSALYFQYGSEFYEMFRTTVHNEMSVSREVKWDESLFAGLSLCEKSCDVKTINAFGVEVRDVAELQPKIAELVAKRPHRYK